MKIKMLRRLIRTEIKGTEGKNFSDLAEFANEAQNNFQSVFNFGREHDADAVLIFIKKDNAVNIVLFAGKTAVFGTGINEYLLDYHDGVSEHRDHCIEWLVDNATDGLKKENVFQIILKNNESDKWRGFRGNEPMSLNEIKAKAIKEFRH